jgi:peptidoglycan/xylan/chitin deacetylase (PgdA/CDA1 family)
MTPIKAFLARGKQAVKRRYAARGLILTYHRIADEPLDPWRLSVTPANFARQLEVLKALRLRLVHVSDLARELEAGQLPRRTVAVSFDDGYHDNLISGRPLLEEYGVPATLFVTAGYVGSSEPFWWDALERIFLHAGTLPEVLELTVDGRPHRWELGQAAHFSEVDLARWSDWKALGDAPTKRHELHNTLWLMLVGAPPNERDRIVSALFNWACMDPRVGERRRPMTAYELQQMCQGGLVEIGAHSLTHPGLSNMPYDVRTHELSASKAILEQILRLPVGGCSYPQGRSTPEVQLQARRAGYQFACGSIPSAVTSRSELYHLPRVAVGNWGGPNFKSFLESHLAV